MVACIVEINFWENKAKAEEKVQEDETDIFKKLIAEGEKSSSKKLKSPPAKKLKSPPAKKVKEHVSCSHIDLDLDVGVSDSNQMWSLRLKKVRQLRKGGMS